MKRFLIIPFIISGGIMLLLPYIESSPYIITEDEYGVPIVDYGWLMGRYVGEKRYPVTIASAADMHYGYYKSNGELEHLEKFFNNVLWLENNRRDIGDFIVFPSDFEYPFYGCKPGWVSGMAQGFALKDFVHAYELSGDERYLGLAKKVLNSYKAEITNGGVLYVDPVDAGYWYAEYSCNTPPRVLNGFWYALDGLYYYYNATGDEEAKELYDQGLSELIRHLSDFDSGDWTYYDMEKYPSDETYHALHVEIMEKLYSQTNNKVFLEHHEKWKQFRYSSLRFNLMLAKNLFHKFILRTSF